MRDNSATTDIFVRRSCFSTFTLDPKYGSAALALSIGSGSTFALKQATLFLTPSTAWELECALRDARRGKSVKFSDYDENGRRRR
jgi:hypothetical protein